MSLQITQYAVATGFQHPAGMNAVPFGPPLASDSLAAGASITTAASAGVPAALRAARILAIGADFNVVWPNGASETFKSGMPELRIVPAGIVLTCAVAST